MASRALAACAESRTTMSRVYGRILSQVKEPVIIHWLGEMFDPAGRLLGPCRPFQGHGRLPRCAPEANAPKIDGIKVSLLDKEGDRHAPPAAEVGAHVHRRRLQLPRPDRRRRGGLFRRAARHLRYHRPGRECRARRHGPPGHGHLPRDPGAHRPLSRHIFRAPTRFYKTGVVFMAWLNGHQNHFIMVGGQQSARSLPHLPSCSAWPMRPACWREAGLEAMQPA
jgi:hypothetical protein